jgi:hypothetical protein
MSKCKVATHSSVILHALVGVLAIGLTLYSNSTPRNLFSGNSHTRVSIMPQSHLETDNLPKAIFGRWVHSREEDTEKIMVFRPATFKFPRSRGRNGFEIREDGVFLLHTIAETDGLRTLAGRWKLTGPGTILALFDDDRIRSYSMKLISCSDDILKIEKRGELSPSRRRVSAAC